MTIQAGATFVVFPITAADNNLQDGSRGANITATATSFTTAVRFIIIRDNEIASYGFSITDLVNLSLPITVSALAVDGHVISGFSGEVMLTIVLSDGGVLEMNPATVTLEGPNGWTGNITLPENLPLPVRLRASDSNGFSGNSVPFDVMHTLALKTFDLVWDTQRSRIYASVPAHSGNEYANKVVVIDPVTLKITDSVTLNEDPRNLALTSDGGKLYVALDGDGTIACVDLGSMSVASTFAIGTDSGGRKYYADDMCTVAGQPDLLVVSRYSKYYAGGMGIVAYDSGIMRPNRAIGGATRVEPSADPSLFFGYNSYSSEFGFYQLQLNSNGMTTLQIKENLVGGFTTDIRSDGNTVFSTSGAKVDGAGMQKLGMFPLSFNAPVCPDLAVNRVYFVEGPNKVSAFDPTTFALMRALTLPTTVVPKTCIRWGANGLAIGDSFANVVHFINSSRLVPSNPPADLALSIEATPEPAWLQQTLTYTVRVVNNGPNPAQDILLTATPSNNQTIQATWSSTGTPTTNLGTITLNAGSLAPGESASLFIRVLPLSAGKVLCKAVASSSAFDGETNNNVASKFVSVGFQLGADMIRTIPMNANNIVYDPVRNVLWITIASSSPPDIYFPNNSLIAIDPLTGLTSSPIPTGESTVERSMVLSPNKRYLYVGLYNSSEILRVDLNSSPYTPVRIPLGRNSSGQQMCAQDIEVLDGDGTSFLMTGAYDHEAVVFDEAVPRPVRTGQYTISRIERIAVPNVFVGYDNYTFPQATFALKKLFVTTTGVTITQSDSTLFHLYYAELRTAGNLLLSNSGDLIDANVFVGLRNLGISGSPCLDGENGRAYVINGNSIYGFDSATGTPTGALSFPSSLGGAANVTPYVRWGFDGFAVAAYTHLDIARWSLTIPASRDQNGDLISDAWEATYFATLNVDPAADVDGDGICNALEYLYVTSPVQSSTNPLKTTATVEGDHSTIHLIFPRRADIAAQAYAYEVSPDLQDWAIEPNVTETLLSTQVIGGVEVQTIDAAVPSLLSTRGFARLKWVGPQDP